MHTCISVARCCPAIYFQSLTVSFFVQVFFVQETPVMLLGLLCPGALKATHLVTRVVSSLESAPVACLALPFRVPSRHTSDFPLECCECAEVSEGYRLVELDSQSPRDSLDRTPRRTGAEESLPYGCPPHVWLLYECNQVASRMLVCL